MVLALQNVWFCPLVMQQLAEELGSPLWIIVGCEGTQILIAEVFLRCDFSLHSHQGSTPLFLASTLGSAVASITAVHGEKEIREVG